MGGSHILHSLYISINSMALDSASSDPYNNPNEIGIMVPIFQMRELMLKG